jgi:hypothetical protein
LFEIGAVFEQSLLQVKPAADLHLREIGRAKESASFDRQAVLEKAFGKIDPAFKTAAHQPRLACDLCVSQIYQLADRGSFDLYPVPMNDAVLAASVEQLLKENTPNHPCSLLRKGVA